MPVVTIKKYPNRRLYDTSRSTYINLEELADRIREGHRVEVVDAKSGDDLTHEVLLQVVLETLKGSDFLPAGMLRRMIRASGSSPQHRMLRQQLVTGLELMSTQMDRWEAVLPSFAAAEASAPSAPAPDPEPAADDELDELRARLADLEARLKRP